MTDEEVAKAWNDGASYLEIAERFGVTRGAVASRLAKMKRQGVPLRVSDIKTPRRVPAPRPPIIQPAIVAARKVEDEPTEEGGTIGLRRHTDAMCKFVVEVTPKGVLYCKGKRLPNRPYCATHNTGKSKPGEIKMKLRQHSQGPRDAGNGAAADHRRPPHPSKGDPDNLALGKVGGSSQHDPMWPDTLDEDEEET